MENWKPKKVDIPVDLKEAIAALTSHLADINEYYIAFTRETRAKSLVFGYIQYLQKEITSKKLLLEQISYHGTEFNHFQAEQVKEFSKEKIWKLSNGWKNALYL